MSNDISTLHQQLLTLEEMILTAEKQGFGDLILGPLRQQIEELRQQLGTSQILLVDTANTQESADPRTVNQGFVTVSDGSIGTVVGLNLGTINNFIQNHGQDEQKQLIRYLKGIANTLRRLPLPGLEPSLDSHGEGMSLPDVYISLATEDRVTVFSGNTQNAKHFFERDDVAAPLLQEYHPDYAMPDTAIIGISRGGMFPHPPIRPLKPQEAPYTTLERSLLATEGIQNCRRIVLLGNPGSGKSTFLRYLAWTNAQELLRQFTNDASSEIPNTAQFGIPILITARQLAQLLHTEQPSARTMVKALKSEFHQYDVDRDDVLINGLDRGTLVVMVDGLDEVPAKATSNMAGRNDVLQCLQKFTAHYTQLSVAITCRERAFTTEFQNILGWTTFTIAPLTLGQIRHFVPAWFKELSRVGDLSAERAQILSDTLIHSITSQHQLRAMAGSPLLLTMMALVLYRDGLLPRDRSLLYDRVVELLLGQWDNARHGDSLGQAIGEPSFQSTTLRPLIEKLSFEAHQNAASVDGQGRLSRSTLYEVMIEFFKTLQLSSPWESAGRCLDYLEHRSGLLVPDDNQTFVITHLTLQEYAAGCHLINGQKFPLDEMMKRRKDDRWHEPLLLGIGATQTANPSLISEFLTRLVHRKEAGKNKSIKRWYRDLILAAEIGEDRDWMRLQKQGVDVDRIQDEVRTGLVCLLNDTNQPLPVEERARAGFLLGNIRDTRYPITISEWKKAIKQVLQGGMHEYFCLIEPGKYPIGSNTDDVNADPWERPQQHILITEPFWISRYPITNQQWEEWSGSAQRRMGTRDADRNHLNQPVGQVSWDDIHSWCEWLSQKTRAHIDVPTAIEWEIAARGPQGYIYPWGNRWIVDRAAIGDIDIRTRRSAYEPPVGCYPAGAAPCGAMDMAGSIWEWTSSLVTAETLQQIGVPRQRIFIFTLNLTPEEQAHRQLCCIKGGAPPYIEQLARGAATTYWDYQNPFSSSDRGFRIVLRIKK